MSGRGRGAKRKVTGGVPSVKAARRRRGDESDLQAGGEIGEANYLRSMIRKSLCAARGVAGALYQTEVGNEQCHEGANRINSSFIDRTRLVADESIARHNSNVERAQQASVSNIQPSVVTAYRPSTLQAHQSHSPQSHSPQAPASFISLTPHVSVEAGPSFEHVPSMQTSAPFIPHSAFVSGETETASRFEHAPEAQTHAIGTSRLNFEQFVRASASI